MLVFKGNKMTLENPLSENFYEAEMFFFMPPNFDKKTKK